MIPPSWVARHRPRYGRRKKILDERGQYTNKYTSSNARPNPDWEEQTVDPVIRGPSDDDGPPSYRAAALSADMRE